MYTRPSSGKDVAQQPCAMLYGRQVYRVRCYIPNASKFLVKDDGCSSACRASAVVDKASTWTETSQPSTAAHARQTCMPRPAHNSTVHSAWTNNVPNFDLMHHHLNTTTDPFKPPSSIVMLSSGIGCCGNPVSIW